MTRRGHTRGQDGIALPVAVFVLTLVMLLTATALISATQSSRRTNKDLEVKLALQAANAGLDLARDRLSPTRITGVLSLAAPCVRLEAPVGDTLVRLVPDVVDSLAPGWCKPLTDTFSNGASSVTRISSDGLLGSVLGGLLGTSTRTIVATGTYGQATRRVALTIGGAKPPQKVFGSYAVSSYDRMQLTNTTVVDGDLRTNGDLDMSVSGQVKGSVSVLGALRMENSSKVCSPGNVAYGSTEPYVNPTSAAKICGSRAATATRFYYPTMPVAPLAADSSNSRLCTRGSSASSQDSCSGPVEARGLDSKRVLTVGSGATVTLSGDKPYLLCGIASYGNGRLIIPTFRDVTVFIDSPENCAGATPRGGMSFTNDMQVDNRNCSFLGRPSDTLELYVLGSASMATSVQWNSSSAGCATIFAPNSTVDFTNDTTFYGAVAAKAVTTSANATIISTSGSASVEVAAPNGAGAGTFRECVGSATATNPGAGCAIG